MVSHTSGRAVPLGGSGRKKQPLKEMYFKRRWSELDSACKDRRQLSERIQKWTEQVNREDITQLGEEGLRQELRIAIKTMQIRDQKCDSIKVFSFFHFVS